MIIDLIRLAFENNAEYQLQLYKMTQISALEINKQIRLKYQHQFFLHFSNLVSELIYDNIHTENRAQSKDILTFINTQQSLLYYFTNEEDEGYYQQAIQESARFFDAPHRIVSELPLMILTDTKDIFMRRRRKLRKILNQTHSQTVQQNNSQSRPDFSSTIAFLGEDISDLTGMLQSSIRSSFYSSSCIDCYKNSRFSSEPSQNLYFQKKQSERMKLKKMVQFQLKHLIVEFQSQQSSQAQQSIKEKNRSQMETEQVKGTIINPTNIEIQSAIRAELKKYKIASIPQTSSLESSSIASRSKLRVRQKALQLLRNLRCDTIF